MQDTDTQQSQSETGNSEDLEITQSKNFDEMGEEASEESQLQTFLKLKEHG